MRVGKGIAMKNDRQIQFTSPSIYQEAMEAVAIRLDALLLD